MFSKKLYTSSNELKTVHYVDFWITSTWDISVAQNMMTSMLPVLKTSQDSTDWDVMMTGYYCPRHLPVNHTRHDVTCIPKTRHISIAWDMMIPK